MPIGIGNGGTEAAFDAKAMLQAMAGPAGQDRCAGNFFWLDFAYSPVRNVPISNQAPQDLREQIFEHGNAACFPFEIVIALDSVPATATDALNLVKRGLKRVSAGLRWRGLPAGCIALLPYPLTP
jgi:hypothetical protein